MSQLYNLYENAILLIRNTSKYSINTLIDYQELYCENIQMFFTKRHNSVTAIIFTLLKTNYK